MANRSTTQPFSWQAVTRDAAPAVDGWTNVSLDVSAGLPGTDTLTAPTDFTLGQDVLVAVPGGDPRRIRTDVAIAFSGSLADVTVTEGGAVSVNAAAGLTAGTNVLYSLRTTASGLAINSGTGAITGTAGAAGGYTVTVDASNAAGTVSRAFTLTVNAPAPPPDPGSLSAAGLLDVAAFNATSAPATVTSGDVYCWGDSITFGNQAQEMVDDAHGWAALENLYYDPAANGGSDVITGGRYPEQVNALITGTAYNRGQPGDETPQVAARLVADTASHGEIAMWSSGTNDDEPDKVDDVINGLATALTAHGDATKFVVMPFGSRPGGGPLARAMPSAIRRWAEANSVTWFDYLDDVIAPVSLQADDDGFTVPAPAPNETSVLYGATDTLVYKNAAHPMFYSQAAPATAADQTHLGTNWTNNMAPAVARLASALSGQAPYLHSGVLPVDWTVAENAKIGDLRITGTPTSGYVANSDGTISGAVYYQNGALYRGPGARPADTLVEVYVVVSAASGAHANRVVLADLAPDYIRYSAGWNMGYWNAPSLSDPSMLLRTGTLSVVFQQETPTSQYQMMGGDASQIGLNSDFTSFNTIFTNDRHWMRLGNGRQATNVYGDAPTGGVGVTHATWSWSIHATDPALNIWWARTNNETAVDHSASLLGTGPLDISKGLFVGGAWGATAPTLAANAGAGLWNRIHHLWISDTYTADTADLSDLFNATTRASALAPGSINLGAVTPLHCFVGGPGRWLTGKNLGTAGDWTAHVPLVGRTMVG